MTKESVHVKDCPHCREQVEVTVEQKNGENRVALSNHRTATLDEFEGLKP